MRAADDVIGRSAEEGARLVALDLLARADDAAAGLADGGGDELHEFRVSVRRLRTALRFFRPWLEEDVSRKLERKLRGLAKRTNEARDAAVHIAWLRSQRAALASRRYRAGVEYLSARVSGTSPARQRDRLVRRYEKASAKLSRRLAARLGDGHAASGGEGSFGVALGTLVSDQLDVVLERMAKIEDALDERGAHRARIEAKRLRYLLEPLAGNRRADASAVVDRLKRLQEVLGELHDAHVFRTDIEDALAAAAAERARRLFAASERGEPASKVRRRPPANPLPGLLAVARLLRERRDERFAQLDREWRGGGMEALADEIRALSEALQGRARAPSARVVHPIAAARRISRRASGAATRSGASGARRAREPDRRRGRRGRRRPS